MGLGTCNDREKGQGKDNYLIENVSRLHTLNLTIKSLHIIIIIIYQARTYTNEICSSSKFHKHVDVHIMYNSLSCILKIPGNLESLILYMHKIVKAIQDSTYTACFL